jgi:hypothetical protein
MSPFLVVVAIRFAGAHRSTAARSDGTKLSVGLAGLARALESQDDAQQPPDGRRAMATSPPRGRQEERNEQSCEGPESDPRRAVSGCAEQGRLLRAGLTRFLWRAPTGVAHVSRPLCERIDPDSAGLPLAAASQLARAVPRRHGERGRAALAERPAAGVLLDDLHLAAFAGLDLHCLCEIALEPLFVELADEWPSSELAVAPAFTHWVVGASWRITWT